MVPVVPAEFLSSCSNRRWATTASRVGGTHVAEGGVAECPRPAAAPSPVEQDAEPADNALFAAAQGGDFGAFETVVQRYHDRIYRVAMGMVKNPLDAEEVVQETFLSVFRQLHRFQHESSPKTWILRIAVNAALMRLRSGRRKPLLALEDHRAGGSEAAAEPFWAPNPWASLPDALVLNAELRAYINKALDKLPEKYRLVLLLRDVEEHSNDEVAHALGLTLPTVKSRLHRGRLIVRQELEDYFRRH